MSTSELLLPERVVVTGGASGIGSAVVSALAQNGSSVGVISRSRESLDRALAEDFVGLEDRIFMRVADVADEEAMASAVQGLATDLGGLDAVVASAGTEGNEMGHHVEDVTSADFRHVLDVNVLGALHLVRFALPHLSDSGNASVTLIGSDSGFVSVPGMLAYNAAKGALVQLTRALAVELLDRHGVRVNSVCPSVVDTPLARRGLQVENFDDAPYPVQTPEDIAWSVLYLSSARSRAVNGVNLLSDFGFTARSNFPA